MRSRATASWPVVEANISAVDPSWIRALTSAPLSIRSRATASWPLPEKNVYDTWMPAHFKNICSAIDQLPSDLNFNVPPLSEATGLSQDLGNLMQSDASCASIPNERGSQSSNAEQQAVTPDTSFKRSTGSSSDPPMRRQVITLWLREFMTVLAHGAEAHSVRTLPAPRPTSSRSSPHPTCAG